MTWRLAARLGRFDGDVVEASVVLRVTGQGPITRSALPQLTASVARFELTRDGERTVVVASFPLPRSESA